MTPRLWYLIHRIQSKQQPNPSWRPSRSSARSLGVGEIVVETEETAVEVAELVVEAAAPTLADLGVAGPTSRGMQTTLVHQFVKNIMFLGSLHTGVKSRLPVHGRTFIYQRINEILTNLILTKYKTLYITVFTRKYMQQPF